MSKLCIICCYSYSHKWISGEDKVGDKDSDDAVGCLRRNQQFSEFCRELEADEGVLFSALEGSSGRGLAVCPDCVSLIDQSVEVKLKVNEVEMEVRKLQRDLLEKIKELQQYVDQFYSKMDCIDKVVRNADISCLQSSVSGDRVGGSVNTRNTRRAVISKQKEGNGVFLFRNRISEVVTEMAAFKDNLDAKFGRDSLPDGTQVKQEIGDPMTPHDLMDWCEVNLREDEIDEEYRPDKEDDLEDPEDNGSNYSDEVISSWSHKMTENLDSLAEFEEKEEKEGPIKRRGFVPPGPQNCPECGNTYPSWKRMRRHLAKVHKKRIGGGECRPKDNHSKPPRRTPLKTPKKSKPLDPLKNLDTSSWSDFKKQFISRVLKRSHRTAPHVNMDDPSLHILAQYPLKYDSTTDSLSISTIIVHWFDDSSNQTFGHLSCSQCDHQVKAVTSTGSTIFASHNLERNIQSHVLGHHLDAFQCPQCQKLLRSYWRFVEHVKGHQGLYVCDICGKSCATKDTLHYHKWGHMNKEEQEEALKNGAKNPKRYAESEKEKPKDAHVCPTCGKGFKTERHLREHEDTHQEVREMMACPKCGKTMLKKSYLVYHKNHGCSALDKIQPSRVHCLKCNLGFKTRQFLNRHMIRVHSEEGMERPHGCPVCSKRFKTRSDLTYHSQIHGEEKLFQCEECGMEFSVKRYWRRHALICGASATKKGEMETKVTPFL